MKKRLFATLLALVMALGLTATAWADDPVTGVKYLDASGAEKNCTSYTEVTKSSIDTWGSNNTNSWYVVSGSVNIGGITVKGYDNFVNLILLDGATLTVGNINIGSPGVEGNLNIYGQSTGNAVGKLTCTGSITISYGSMQNNSMMINGGAVNVNGGITVQSSSMDKGSLTVNGGTVNVSGGITVEGDSFANASLTVNGGKLSVTNSGDAIRIQGNTSAGTMNINGGTVIAKSTATGGRAINLDNKNDPNSTTNLGNLILPNTTYWWRTVECGDFTASTSEPGYVQNIKTNSYEEFTTQTNPVNTNAHQIGTWVDEIPATCTENGTKGHKDCSVCNKHFDANDVEITDLTIPAGHTLTHVDAKDATHQETGNIEYWQCSGCKQCFADEKMEKPIDQADTIIAKLPPKKNNSTTAATTETVASPNTADAGVLISGALSVVSLLGMGYVGKKR